MKRMERRRSSSSIDTLRRELRKSDQERFYMQAAVNSAAGQWLSDKPPQAVRRRSAVIAVLASTAGVCLLLLGGLLWKRLDTPRSGGQGRPVTVASEPVDARIVDRTENPVPQTIATAPQSTAVRGRGAVAAAPQKGGRGPGPRAVSAGRRQTRRPDAVAPPPRPLSPGEFGRTPSR
jgi:hypothetical protein